MLVENGFLSAEQLETALSDQKKQGLKLGQYLARQGLVSEMHVADLLCRQMQIEKFHPDKFPVDKSIASIIPFETAQKYQVAALLKKRRLLIVSMTDPFDIHALDAIEACTNCEVTPVLCSETELNSLHKTIYTQSGLGGVVESMEDADITIEKTEDQPEEIQIESIRDMALNTPAVIRLVNSIIASAVQERASDIHISPQQSAMQVRFRIDGRLYSMPAPPKSMFLAVAARLKVMARMDITQSRIPQDGRFTIKLGTNKINVRASTIPTLHGENIVLRLLDSSAGILTLDNLGMSPVDVAAIRSLIHRPHGMILSTGPTGSGKTSTLFSILQEINEPHVHIITIEDPVEYKIDSIRQIQLNERAGMTFANGLRSILRQDPDIIMIGEIRDSETAQISVAAAQTGHRLLSTVHTNDSVGVIARLIDLGVAPFLVASVLLTVFAQRLIRTICPYCKEPYTPPASALASLGLEDRTDAVFMRGRGCQQCLHTGYKGRTGIYEVLVNDENVQSMIIKGASAQDITREAVSTGMLKTLKQDVADKVARGITTLEEAEATVMA